MQSAIRPYARAGVALVGASVIAVTPIAPAPAADMRITSPAVQLAAATSPSELAFLEDKQNVASLQSLTIGSILAALGIQIPEIPGLPIGDVPINVITTGPPFGALGLLGLNPFWVPAFPDAIARQINEIPYISLHDWTINYSGKYTFDFGIGTYTVTYTVAVPINGPDFRAPIVLAWGLGSLATGMAYPQVVADLPNQLGGTAVGAPQGSSFTILPLILLGNPGRANGGLAARFAPLFHLVGLNTVTPDVAVQQSGNAVLVPLKVDATIEYNLLSDFPSWPNPFSLANSVAAALFPTYILRGTDINGLLNSVQGQVAEPLLDNVIGNVLSAGIGNSKTVSVNVHGPLGLYADLTVTIPRAILLTLAKQVLPQGIDIPAVGYEAYNQYVTLQSDALPLLEPFRLPFDLLNILAGGNYFYNPFADALEPALRILVNLGYPDVQQSHGYDRGVNFFGLFLPYIPGGLNANAGGVPFGTLPNVNWGQALVDVTNALILGVQHVFFSSGIPGFDPTGSQPNPTAALLALLGLPMSPHVVAPAVNSLPSTSNPVQTLTVSDQRTIDPPLPSWLSGLAPATATPKTTPKTVTLNVTPPTGGSTPATSKTPNTTTLTSNVAPSGHAVAPVGPSVLTTNTGTPGISASPTSSPTAHPGTTVKTVAADLGATHHGGGTTKK